MEEDVVQTIGGNCAVGCEGNRKLRYEKAKASSMRGNANRILTFES
jgi:hypothetical protein